MNSDGAIDKGVASNQLLDLLCEDPPNALRIRALCRDHPGLIASAGLRLKIWSILVLGSSKQDDFDQDVIGPTVSCGEQQVLDADVHRTRAELEQFRSPTWRHTVKVILQKLCVDHDIQYKQGMNEVLAPFLLLNPPPDNQLITYALFRAFLFRYLERFFCVDDSSYLFKAFRLFHLLLLSVDPQLAFHLNDLDFVPELYAPQWFLTLFARALPISHVLRVWDMIIAVDDPGFVFFIGVCLLRSARAALLSGDAEHIPETISKIHFSSEEDIDKVMCEAIALYRSTPRCVLRGLRLCCVSTVELTPQPARSPSSVRMDVEDYDQALSVQSARSCFVLSPQELVECVQQFVIIDVRSVDACVVSGGGSLPRAIQLEPEFLNRPEAFDVWLQHFDGTRGCQIVLVDLPPANWAGIALWRRLLLGEGDGNLSQFRGRYEFDDLRENKRRLEALIASSTNGRKNVDLRPQQQDSQSKHYTVEAEVAQADLNSPAMLLAIALQRNSFPFVSVLDGGFPALVAYLTERQGSVEPIIINHDPIKWESFLKSTGRSPDQATAKARFRAPTATVPKEGKAAGAGERTLADITDIERWEMALAMADRLGHTHMKAQLAAKLAAARSVDEQLSS